MLDWIMTVLFFVEFGVIYLVVSYIGDKIADKGIDSVENSFKRKKNATNEDKAENLADRYRY